MKKMFTGIVFFCCAINIDAQVDCSKTDIFKVPGKWVWDKRGGGDRPVSTIQWQICEPIRKELQRIIPIAPDGLHATNSIAFGEQKAVASSKLAPYNYDCYLMLKKYECLKAYNKLQPEGETGCWIYFKINGIDNKMLPSLHFPFYENEGNLYVGDFYTTNDAAGNRILYVSQFGKPDQKMGYYFSGKDRLPMRKITWKELIQSYKIFSEKEMSSKLIYLKEGITKNENELSTTSYADTKEYLTKLIAGRKEEVKKMETQIAELQQWQASMQVHKKINEPALVKNIRMEKREIEKCMNGNDEAEVYPVWIEDIHFFDLQKPKDQPQCIYLSMRGQDDELPKKNFMELFCGQFNIDVLCKMSGEVLKKSDGINTVNASVQNAKTETNVNQQTGSVYNYNFENAVANQFPSGWQGMNNIAVQPHGNSNCLAITKDGYWYPQQYNKEIKDKFNFSFNLGWNKDIAYNSGEFMIAFSSINYDNTKQQYAPPANHNMMCLYDSYTGNFNRVVLWFDPYWNNGGRLTVYSYEKGEKLLLNKTITLPAFSQTNNEHQISIQRKGNTVVVLINNKSVAEINDVFIPAVNYNLFSFSRYKGNNSDNKNDVFYLSNISVAY